MQPSQSGSAWNLFERISAVLSGYGIDDAPEVIANPMQSLMDECRMGGAFSLSDVVKKAFQRGLGGPMLANLENINCSHMVFDSEGLRLMRSQPDVMDDIQLTVSGAVLDHCSFKPASLASEIRFNDVDTRRVASARHMVFSGFQDESTVVHFEERDVSGLSVEGLQHSPHANIVLHLQGCKATDMHVAGSRYTEIYAQQGSGTSDMRYLNAASARALRISAHDVCLDGSSFANATFAPESSMRGSSLIGVDFSHTAMGNLDLSDCVAWGIRLRGTDISAVNMQGMSAMPEDFIGCTYQGHSIETQEQARGLLAAAEINFILPEEAASARSRVEMVYLHTGATPSRPDARVRNVAVAGAKASEDATLEALRLTLEEFTSKPACAAPEAAQKPDIAQGMPATSLEHAALSSMKTP